MDTPLLALTRSALAQASATPESIAAKNMRQLVQLRWLAVAGQLVAVLVAQFQLDVVLPLGPILATIAALALANLAFQIALPRHRASDIELLLALLLDVAVLTVLLWFSGGATNPFVSLYLLQVVLGAILLPAGRAWLVVAATGLAYGGLSVAHLPLAIPPSRSTNLLLLGDWLSFAMVAVLLVLFSARITRNLRARDAYLAEMAQRAAEEDGIMRMGLFASNAAHELGTPLATLSVILSDWQRHPKLIRDRELARELTDMRGEVQRCTAIVADILRSVGQARGESMQRVAVGDLLGTVARDWRQANPETTLTVDLGDAASERVPAEPALRQALANLLDNAAYVSPQAVALSAALAGGEIALSVRDRGPGFAPGEIDKLGTPYHSTKGPGHGLGLFLVATVARRLGGRFAARNLPDGGAEASVLLPRAEPVAWPGDPP